MSGNKTTKTLKTEPKKVSFSSTTLASQPKSPSDAKPAQAEASSPAAKVPAVKAEKKAVAVKAEKKAASEPRIKHSAKGNYLFFLRRLNRIIAEKMGFKRAEIPVQPSYAEYIKYIKAEKKVPQTKIDEALEIFFGHKL